MERVRIEGGGPAPVQAACVPPATAGSAAGPPATPMARFYPQGTQIALHAHQDAQLLFASRGLMQVSTPTGRWLVPPERAVWLPPRMEHSVDVLAELEMRSMLISRSWLRRHPQAARLGRAFVVAVAPLLRQVILRSFDREAPQRLRSLLAEVVLYELPEAEDPGVFVPLPRDSRARRVAEQVLAKPAGQQSLDDLALAAGASARTISRLFPAETGLSFKAWRQRARILAALEILSEGRLPMKQVAVKLGFSSTAAFSHAFRQVMSVSPGGLRRGPRA